ncbi:MULTISPECIES: CBS domain-containing protein [unclassified Amycolatopsis]|uniref:CBS domain-containing protein n=1 Tax=unclassified Amycolatopsis TaxID=2618356 RepID=UPI002874EAB8|nr:MULTISPECIES: CBS domain-containing protein [unclassified Amycolatopsis]MDS0134749.1 CBS domain-containing protein [Amycolatopsis sp. 505]MDS0148075.1 CBS domain-containing protein [Amycolatopsis sp. CM201R]
MRGPQVSDLMTWPVVTAGPGTTFKELVSLLAEHGIAAIPVLDEHRRPIGVVDEVDLLARHRSDHKPEPVFWKRRVWTKAQGLTARELMTRRVPTVAKDEPVAGAARRLVEAKLRRLYVVDGSGRLIGVLARRDVLRAFLRPDEELKETVEREVLQRSIWADPATVTVQVDDGVVTLSGVIDRRSEVERAEWLTESVPGVVAVRNRLKYTQDDGASAGLR